MQLYFRAPDSTLEYLDDEGALRWELPIKALVMIAEYTTANGPMVDDYFLIFVALEAGQLFFAPCSFYIDGRDEVLAALRERLHSPVELGLLASTDWKSRVVWPAAMAGKEYYTTTEVVPQKFSQKLKKTLFGTDYEYAISKTVQEYLDAQLANRK